MNLAAIEEMNRKFPRAKLCFIDSGGDNSCDKVLPGTGRPDDLCDRCRENTLQRRPGITRSDLLAINRIDLAPLVGANLEVMEADALKIHVKRPSVFTNLKGGEGAEQIASFVIEKGGFRHA